MKNIFDAYFEIEYTKEAETVNNVYNFIISNFKPNNTYTNYDIKMQILNLIVQYLELTYLSITNTELNIIMTILRKKYNFN